MALLGPAAAAAAQTPLTLPEAIVRARTQHPAAGSSAAAERAAAGRVTAASAGYLPKLDVVESWQRGNQPVFVFGSLLAQRQFTAANFAVGALNHPNALDNFHAALTMNQTLFDAATRADVAAARLNRQMSAAHRRMVDRDLAAGVTAAYGDVLLAAAARRSADAAVETARADRELAGNRRDAGLATDADVLQADVYVSRSRERQILAASEERIARARLNAAMGEPLDEAFVLDPSPAAAAIDIADLSLLEAEAIKNRPDVTLADLDEQLAAAGRNAARAAFLPQLSMEGNWEFNGGDWSNRQSSWLVGVVARINLFHGFADKARLVEATEETSRRAFERQKTVTTARLDVRVAAAKLDAARASQTVGRAAVAQARESRRIIRDRYEAGLIDVASLLRATDAVVQAEMQQIAADVTVLTQTAALERALGR
jgi:outer membrane protein TolC